MVKMSMALIGLSVLGAAAPATAAPNAMQVCGAKYRAAKQANQLPAGQTWPQYLAACRAATATPAAPAPAAPGSVAPATPAASRAPSADQLAARERQHKCGAMWKADRAAGKVPAGQTWPRYWSACNARLKG